MRIIRFSHAGEGLLVPFAVMMLPRPLLNGRGWRERSREAWAWITGGMVKVSTRELDLQSAATYEAAGESITLDPSLWGDAGAEQEKRASSG
jgi:hypothetical protein